MAAYRSVRAEDPQGARRISGAVARLAADPYPGDSTALGGTSFRRLRLDRYRVLYEVAPGTVSVMHVGSVLSVCLLSGWVTKTHICLTPQQKSPLHPARGMGIW
jgi:mRNA interferase RelE/StbE